MPNSILSPSCAPVGKGMKPCSNFYLPLHSKFWPWLYSLYRWWELWQSLFFLVFTREKCSTSLVRVIIYSSRLNHSVPSWDFYLNLKTRELHAVETWFDFQTFKFQVPTEHSSGTWFCTNSFETSAIRCQLVWKVLVAYPSRLPNCRFKSIIIWWRGWVRNII